jgi:PIN domain nuclease of toxin-antitoxin system
VRLLLDTHTAIWWVEGRQDLSAEVVGAIESSENEVFVSAATIWEVAIKSAIGRLSLPGRLDEIALEIGLTELPIRWVHAQRSSTLPLLHRDPFDRMLVAQALEERLILATRDEQIKQYDVPVLSV